MRYILVVMAVILTISLSCSFQTNIPVPETPIPSQPQNVEPPAEEYVETTTPAPVKKIAFIRDCGTQYKTEIFTIDSDGNNEMNVTNSPSADLWPSWSPDGEQIVFTSEWAIYVIDMDGNNRECLTLENGGQFPAWSPDGRTIAYTSASRLFTMSIDGANSKQVISIRMSSQSTNPKPERQFCPAWFPDSKRLAFASDMTGVWEIYSVNIDGSSLAEHHIFVDVIHGMRFPRGTFPIIAVSPNGSEIAFDYCNTKGERDIYILTLANDEARCLTGKLKNNCYCPTWSPDGTKIAFTMEIEKKFNPTTFKTESETDIYIIDADGNNPTLLIENGAYPVWQR
jgi:Tol biopolymer transport system component